MNKSIWAAIGLLLIVTAVPFAYATNYYDMIDIRNGWRSSFFVSHVPNSCGNYDHACVYEDFFGYATSQFFYQSHTVYIQELKFSVNPNNIVWFDVYSPQAGILYSSIKIQGATLGADGKYHWNPSNQGASTTFTYNSGGHDFSYCPVPLSWECARNYMEFRAWDNKSPTVYTYSIQWAFLS